MNEPDHDLKKQFDTAAQSIERLKMHVGAIEIEMRSLGKGLAARILDLEHSSRKAPINPPPEQPKGLYENACKHGIPEGDPCDWCGLVDA